jgi:hypothetical protein
MSRRTILSQPATSESSLSQNKNTWGWDQLRSKLDDIMCVLLRGNLPFVLRTQDNDEDCIVGESYVHGLMDGEAVRGKEDNEFRRKV